VDEANHFQAQVPEGWYPIRQSLVNALTRQIQENAASKETRYVSGYSMSPEGELTLPYVLFQIVDGDMNRLSESELIRLLHSKPLKPGVSDTLWDIVTNPDLEEVWDPVERQSILPFATEAPGIGSVRGVFVARVSSRALVQINCYARASELDAAMPAFQEWIDGVEIDAEYAWKPGSERGIDWRQVGWTGLTGGIMSALGALIYMYLRRSRA